MDDIFIIADDVNFEILYFDYFFQGKEFHKDIASFIKDYMKNKYDENIKFKKKYKWYFTCFDKGKIVLYYKDCSCLFSKKHDYLTKEIFFYKLKRF